MKIDERILKELNRHRSINRYISEQADLPPAEAPADLPPADAALPPAPEGDPAADPMAAGAPPATEPPAAPTPVDTANDPDVEKIDDAGSSEESPEGGEGTEELDITDLVNSQKNIETKQEEYFQNLFSHLENLENKLAEMDNIVNKLNSLEIKVEKMKPKTPQEKLELRSLDSFPFNQKLTDFFDDKQDEMIASGKNEYVLTTDDVQDISPNEISKTFGNFDQDTMNPLY